MTFVESRTYSHDNKEKDLHTLIKNNPQLIAPEQEDGKRLPTAIIGSEMSLPSGRLDLLLMDIEGRLTLVELKRGRAAREVIAQTLNYAADLHYTTLEELEELVRGNTGYNSLSDVVAKLQEENSEFEEVDIDEIRKQISDCLNGKDLQLLIVSYEVDEETKKIARFLRNTYGIKIWCVEFDYFQSDEFEFFVPETAGLEDVKQIESKGLTPKQRAYKEFFGEILSRLKEKEPGIRRESPPPRHHFCSLHIGYSNIHFQWTFHKRPDKWFEVGLHFEKSSAEENRRLLEHFKSIQDELKEELGGLELIFEYPWFKRWARIYVSTQKTEMDEELKNWAVETMLKFYRVFKPRLDEILSS